MTVWKLLGRSHKIAMHSFRKVTSTMKRQKTRNPVESHDKFPTINPAISTFLPAIPARWLFAIVQLKKFASAVREPEKKIPSKQFLLIYFPVAKDVLPWSGKKVCFGLRLIRLARSLYRMGEVEGRKKKTVKICGVTLESSQFIVREWFSSFSFEQTNIKICFHTFHFHGNDFFCG